MKINENSWMVFLIRSTYNINTTSGLPKSLCTFFWTFVSTLLFMPFCYPTHIINLFIRKKYQAAGPNTNYLMFGMHVGWSMIMFLVGGVISISFIDGHHMLDGQHSQRMMWMYIMAPISIIALLGCIALVIAVCYGISVVFEWLRDKIKNNKKSTRAVFPVEKKPSLLAQFLAAKKEKICPIIKYES